MTRLSKEREAELRAKPPNYHVHELWPELEALRSELSNERARCLAWVQHAREQGETDMRQLRAWIERGEWPESDNG